MSSVAQNHDDDERRLRE
jgi:hypothetical protein